MRHKNKFNNSLILNNETYLCYFNRLKELALTAFKWEGLPDTIDARFLELSLFENGKAVFFKDEVLDYLALNVGTQGKLNVYGVPLKRRAFSNYNRYNKLLNADNSVIIFNNYLRTNSYLDVQNFALRLYNLDRIIDVNANAQKTPVLISCDENQRLTLLNVYQQWDGNEPVIFGNKGLNLDGLSVLKTDAPYVADKIYELKTQIWNEALTYLGISNVNINKKERLLTDEVNRSLGGAIASRYSRLNARKEAAEQINKMFGLNICVEYHEDVEPISEPSADQEGGDVDE